MTALGGDVAARVLVADDDEAMRTTIVFTLMDDGYEVVEASSGAEVLRIIEGAASGRLSERIDLVVMDVRMPALSGLETVRRLRELDRPTPVILMTAFASPETMDEAKALRTPLLSKPFSLAELCALARRTLRPDRIE